MYIYIYLYIYTYQHFWKCNQSSWIKNMFESYIHISINICTYTYMSNCSLSSSKNIRAGQHCWAHTASWTDSFLVLPLTFVVVSRNKVAGTVKRHLFCLNNLIERNPPPRVFFCFFFDQIDIGSLSKMDRLLTPVAGLNLLPEKVSDSPNFFSRNSSFRILFYCVHSWGCGLDSKISQS